MDLPSPTPISPSVSLDLNLTAAAVNASDLPPLPSSSSQHSATSSTPTTTTTTLARPKTAPANPKPKSFFPRASVTTESVMAADVARPPPSPIVTPAMRTRMRTASGSSMTFLQPGPITLVDHTLEPSDRSAGLFARNVIVGDYTVVSGSRVKGAGAYVCWNITVETLEGHKILIRKRYSEFVTLRERLLASFPYSVAAMPQLPPKSLVSKFRPKFLETRRKGLNYFLSCILMNPEFCGSPPIKEFLFDYD